MLGYSAGQFQASDTAASKLSKVKRLVLLYVALQNVHRIRIDFCVKTTNLATILIWLCEINENDAQDVLGA